MIRKSLLLVAVDSGGCGDIFPDIRRMHVGGGEPEQQEGGGVARDIHRLGAGGDGPRLLPRPHLRRPLQPRRHYFLRHLQTLPMEAGKKQIRSRRHLPRCLREDKFHTLYIRLSLVKPINDFVLKYFSMYFFLIFFC